MSFPVPTRRADAPASVATPGPTFRAGPAHWLIGPAAALALAVALTAQAPAGGARAFLAEHFGFTARDLREIDARRPVVRSLPTTDGREIATACAIRVDVPPAFYADRVRDIVGFKRHEAVLQIGTFGTPARPEDAAALTLDAADIEDLRACRVGDCKVQLSAGAIAHVATEVAWNAAGAGERATALMRRLLAGVVNEYRARGDAALMVYRSKDRPLSVAAEFRAMAAAAPALLPRLPLLHAHVAKYPVPSGSDAEDVFYWSKEKVGPKVIISVTHLAIVRVGDNGPVAYTTASKQLYATHYFDASLGIALLLRPDGGGPSATDVVYVNRSRVNVLGGFFGALTRGIARSRTRSGMAESLLSVRSVVERAFAAAVPGGR